MYIYNIIITQKDKTMEFVKATYSEEQAKQEQTRLENKFEALKDGYSLVSVDVCLTNGMSAYVTIKKEGENKDFVFRISNHKNGNRGTEEGTLSVQCQGENINDMYVYYGDITKEEARLSFLNEAIKKYEEGTAAYKGLKKQIEKLTK
jgi:hypothetical protein